jgi:uncharacterized membrane protein
MSSRCLSTVAATAVLSFAPCLHGQLVFTPLGDLAGGDTLSYGNTVSADGIVVAGLASDAGGNRASIWNGGWQTLGDFAGGENYSEAFAISADGGVVVGQSHGTTGYKSFRWTQAGGFQSLGDLASTGLDSEARGVSANGSVIVGAYNERTNPGGGGILADAYRWTQAGGLQDLGDLPVATVSAWRRPSRPTAPSWRATAAPPLAPNPSSGQRRAAWSVLATSPAAPITA